MTHNSNNGSSKGQPMAPNSNGRSTPPPSGNYGKSSQQNTSRKVTTSPPVKNPPSPR